MNKATTKTASIDFSAVNRFTYITLLTLGAYLLLANSAFAQGSPMGEVLCSAVAMVMGDLGRGLATIAVIAVGVGALIGKASWGMAITVATGIAVVFGAPGIVMALGVEEGGCSEGSGGGLAQYYQGYGAGAGAGNVYNTASSECNGGSSGVKGAMTAFGCGTSQITNLSSALQGASQSGGVVGSVSSFLR